MTFKLLRKFIPRRTSLAFVCAIGLTIAPLLWTSFDSMSVAAMEPDDDIEDEIDEDIEDEIEDEVEDEVEDELEEDIEDELEDELERELEQELADEIEQHIEEEYEDELDEDIEEVVEDELEDIEFEDEIAEDDWPEHEDEDDIEADPEEDIDLDPDVEHENENGHDDEHQQDASEDSDELIDARVSDEIDIALDENGDEIALNEWLVLMPEEHVEELDDLGFSIEDIDQVTGLGLVIARIEGLGSQSFEDVELAIKAISPDSEVDRNHLYSPGASPVEEEESTNRQHSSASFQTSGAIGVVDTAVELAHPSLEGANITQRDFVDSSGIRPSAHGTAVLSILASRSDTIMGLMPNARFASASVFFETQTGAVRAPTSSLISALGWLVEERVDVINISLTGPANRLLEAAIRRTQSAGVPIVAAVGNDGPAAAPLYPAAYPDVIGVTAVSENKNIYRLANRGTHVDLAAPGVGVTVAAPEGRYVHRSGTSFAAPFVAAAILSHKSRQIENNSNWLDTIVGSAEDLGAPGRDPIFGHGLVRFQDE